MNRQLSKLTALILVPVLLLAVIAVIGLIEYRHAVTEDARVLAEQWTTRADRMYEDLVRQTEPINETILFSDVPAEGTSDSAGVERLERAAEAKDEEALLGLIQSKEMTPSGLPIRALAAWRLYELTGDENLVVGSKNWSTPKPSQFLSVGTAVYLKDVFIHESPSAISAPIVEAVAEHSEFAWQWRNEWKISERKRSVLERHRGAQGFVMEQEGPALIVGRKVLLPEEVRNYLKVRLSTAKYPAWMKIDYQALNQSLVSPIAEPFATGGDPMKMVIGIGDYDVLYADY